MGTRRPIPRPGIPVRGSKSGRPIMAALDLLGRRWALRILWELREGRLTFRAIRESCEGVSPSVLNSRLRELRDAGVVEHGEGGYALTQAGESLRRSLVPLYRWAEEWGKRS